jgi:hypothetical protein
MATPKQNFQIYMGAYIYTGTTYKAFASSPALFDVWNVDIEERSDFLGSPNTQTLTGYERGNPMGFRTYAVVDLDNSYPSASTNILALLNNFASQFPRAFFTTTITASTSTTLTFNSGVATTDYYTGLLVRNTTLGQTRTIIGYTSGRVATLDSPTTEWAIGNNITIQVPPSIPTLMGITSSSANSNYMYFNLDSSIFGVSRQLTVGNQVISIDLRGVERKSAMADNVRIGV